jgi:hypothetical protein
MKEMLLKNLKLLSKEAEAPEKWRLRELKKEERQKLMQNICHVIINNPALKGGVVVLLRWLHSGV